MTTNNDTNKDIVLIVDDIEINRTILCEILRGDYQTVEADGGVSALECLFDSHGRARKVLPTVVLLDVMMPDIDGLEFSKESNPTRRQKIFPYSLYPLPILSKRSLVVYPAVPLTTSLNRLITIL